MNCFQWYRRLRGGYWVRYYNKATNRDWWEKENKFYYDYAEESVMCYPYKVKISIVTKEDWTNTWLRRKYKEWSVKCCRHSFSFSHYMYHHPDGTIAGFYVYKCAKCDKEKWI